MAGGWFFYLAVFYMSLLYLRDGTYMKEVNMRRMTAMKAQREAADKAKAAAEGGAATAAAAAAGETGAGNNPKAAYADDADFSFDDDDDEFGNNDADADVAAASASPQAAAGAFDAGPQAEDEGSDDYGAEANADAGADGGDGGDIDSGFDDGDGFGGDDDDDDEDDDGEFAEPAVTRGGGRRNREAAGKGASVRAKTSFGRASVFKVVVQYCVSWSYKRNYVELQRYLEQIYPDLIGNVSGGNYPPPTWAAVLAQAAGMFQMLGIMLAFFGDGLFRLVGVPTPDWYTAMSNNKLMVVGGLFLFNSVAQNMCATGAFEISLNGKPVFSKLSSGRMPSVQEIRTNLERYGVKPLRRGAQFSGTGAH